MEKEIDDILEEPFKKYRNAKKAKKESLLKEREKYLLSERKLMIIMLAIALDYRQIYPNASGSIVARVKGKNSLSTKIDNEFATIQSLEDATQDDMIKRIENIYLKDIFATSVITDGIPTSFTTGNDELDEILTNLLNKVIDSENRIMEHKNFIKINQQALERRENEREKLMEEYQNAREQKEIDVEYEAVNNEFYTLIEEEKKNGNRIKELDDKRSVLKEEESKEKLKELIDKIRREMEIDKQNIKYLETSLKRTEHVYEDELSELQYEMSSYYVQTAAEHSNLKFWKTKSIRTPKIMKKNNGFRAVNTGYAIEKDGKIIVNFEIQGKGKIDYNKAEYGDGADYHENQKTAEGQRSKRNYMPDFTILGDSETRRIEEEVKSEYADMDMLEILEGEERKQYEKEMSEYRERLLSYKYDSNKDEKLQQLLNVRGITYLTEKVIDNLVEEQEKVAREMFIEKQCDKKIFEAIIKKAESEISTKSQIKSEYDKIKTELQEKYKNTKKDKDTRIDNEAKIRLLTKRKAREILEETEDNVPLYLEAIIPKSSAESPIVYKLTPGECIYRNYYNRLKGLTKSNGTVVLKAQPHQEKALFLLTDLFDENYCTLLDLDLEEKEDYSK